ncbi:hypothetical protein CEXT_37861 [Caerostris extrusa]|uniref:Uncharacterized protein n=1 Tax=Caerostris extrusa TaxID=172846 RepID=A0AAV4TW07_CAEEX|nr:hypothetical protein CEXT_37861 [Caerostris extrusa]
MKEIRVKAYETKRGVLHVFGVKEEPNYPGNLFFRRLLQYSLITAIKASAQSSYRLHYYKVGNLQGQPEGFWELISPKRGQGKTSRTIAVKLALLGTSAPDCSCRVVLLSLPFFIQKGSLGPDQHAETQSAPKRRRPRSLPIFA